MSNSKRTVPLVLVVLYGAFAEEAIVGYLCPWKFFLNLLKLTEVIFSSVSIPSQSALFLSGGVMYL